MLNKCCRLYAHSVSLSSPDFHVAVGPGACRRQFRSADGLNWERERDPATWGTETSLGFFISERVKVTSTESSRFLLTENVCVGARGPVFPGSPAPWRSSLPPLPATAAKIQGCALLWTPIGPWVRSSQWQHLGRSRLPSYRVPRVGLVWRVSSSPADCRQRVKTAWLHLPFPGRW